MAVQVFSMEDRPSRFGRDRERIIGSRAFRRLAGKTQVVALPSDPLVRTRLTHTLEGSSIAREIARGLRRPANTGRSPIGAFGLREPLVDAIALGHDIGHPAFGHAGERALAAIVPGGFHPAAHGVRVVTLLEPTLDLAPETVDGILKHSKGRAGAVFARGGGLASLTCEARVVRAADLYAYACHDLDDAYLLGELRRQDLPRRVVTVLGDEPADVRRALVERTIASSHAKGDVSVDLEAETALQDLRAFLYERLYESRRIASQTSSVRALIEWLWAAARERPLQFQAALARFGLAPPRAVFPDAVMDETMFVDAVAAMTDRQVLDVCRSLRLPIKVWSVPRAPAAAFRETSP